MQSQQWNRRTAIAALGAGAFSVATIGHLEADETSPIKGRIKQSVCKWCYSPKVPLESWRPK